MRWAAPPVTLRCPFCHGMATLSSFGTGDMQIYPGGVNIGRVHIGSRYCPNPDCHAHVVPAPCGRLDEVVWASDETAPLNRSERGALEKLEGIEYAARDRTPLAATPVDLRPV